MRKLFFEGLFEDEIMEELRTAGRATITADDRRYEGPYHVMHCEDGLYSSAVTYLMYSSGAYIGTTTAEYIAANLAHKAFHIETED